MLIESSTTQAVRNAMIFQGFRINAEDVDRVTNIIIDLVGFAPSIQDVTRTASFLGIPRVG